MYAGHPVMHSRRPCWAALGCHMATGGGGGLSSLNSLTQASWITTARPAFMMRRAVLLAVLLAGAFAAAAAAGALPSGPRLCLGQQQGAPRATGRLPESGSGCGAPVGRVDAVPPTVSPPAAGPPVACPRVQLPLIPSHTCPPSTPGSPRKLLDDVVEEAMTKAQKAVQDATGKLPGAGNIGGVTAGQLEQQQVRSEQFSRWWECSRPAASTPVKRVTRGAQRPCCIMQPEVQGSESQRVSSGAQQAPQVRPSLPGRPVAAMPAGAGTCTAVGHGRVALRLHDRPSRTDHGNRLTMPTHGCPSSDPRNRLPQRRHTHHPRHWKE